MIDPASGEFFANPADTVILAQTGVTGVQIDNLSIVSKSDTASTLEQGADFTITQPGAADFLDQIQLAKAYLGISQVPAIHLYLEIRFQGYTDYVDDPDQGGEIAQISGPHRYKLILTDISVEINEGGSVYNVKTKFVDFEAYNDIAYKLPYGISTVGKTLTEHLAVLQDSLNQWHTTEALSEVPDEFVIDTSSLVGTSTSAGGKNSLEIITDDSLITSSDLEAEDLNRITDEIWKIGSAIDRQQELDSTPVYTGTSAEPIFDEDKISFRTGVSIDHVLATLLSMCPEYYSKVTRKVNILDDSAPPNMDQPYISWFRVLTKVDIIGYDKRRGVHAQRYTYTPILYKTTRPDIALDPAELAVSAESAELRLGQLINDNMLLKSYNYLFTGQNDQILSLDIKYDNGRALLMPPSNGTTGDFSVEARNLLNSQASATEDLTLEGVTDFFEKSKKIVESTQVTDLFKNLGNLQDSLTDNLLGQLQDATGLDPVQMQSVIADKTGILGQSLVESLTDKQVSQLAANSRINSRPASPTEPPSTTLTNAGTAYEPAFSGFAYSADILNPNEVDAVKASDLLEKGYLISEKVGDVKDVTMPVTNSVDASSQTKAATYTGARNKMFGFLVDQHAADVAFPNIELTVRGDPWYISRPTLDLDDSSPEQLNQYRHDNCFWLELRTPIKYDPDHEDEDSALNSGYWRYDGVNRTFTGLYRILGFTSNFSNGSYTVDVSAQRMNLTAHNVKRKPPSNTTTLDTLGDSN